MTNTVRDILPGNRSETLFDEFLGVYICPIDNSLSLHCLKVVLHFGEDHFYRIVFRRVDCIKNGLEVQLGHLLKTSRSLMYGQIVHKKCDPSIGKSLLELLEPLDELILIDTLFKTFVHEHSMLLCYGCNDRSSLYVDMLRINLYVSSNVTIVPAHDGSCCEADFIKINYSNILRDSLSHLIPQFIYRGLVCGPLLSVKSLDLFDDFPRNAMFLVYPV